jgi:hypothetical protein
MAPTAIATATDKSFTASVDIIKISPLSNQNF